MGQSSQLPASRLGTFVVLFAALVVACAIGVFAWVLWWTEAPGLERLFKVSGRVKSIELPAAKGAHAAASLTVDRAGTDFVLSMPEVERLPERDWPLRSVLPGDQVVAWYVPTQSDGSKGILWQLYRNRLRVIALEDRAKLQGERRIRAVRWCVAAAVAGAALLAVGYLLRRRALARATT